MYSVAFEGNTKTQIIDDKIYGGPLMRQYEQVMQWLKGKLDVRYEIEGSGPRKEILEIPETALKEAIINAFLIGIIMIKVQGQLLNCFGTVWKLPIRAAL